MAKDKYRVTVVGDICLDVVGVPIPRDTSGEKDLDNWQQTGETRTFYLPGGSLLLQHFVDSALKFQLGAKYDYVDGPSPVVPTELTGGIKRTAIKDIARFLKFAERLKREEIVHSLLELDSYIAKPDGKKDDKRLRVSETFGFSGPDDPGKSLTVEAPSGFSDVLVIDDTGNRFRVGKKVKWPHCLITNDENELKKLDGTILIHKLHRPLPTRSKSKKRTLWQVTKSRFGDRRVVVVSIQDLRDCGVMISRGLSWERTALDVVWQLKNNPLFSELKDCPHLIIRFGLDGALYWHNGTNDKGEKVQRAWLVYDPQGIEGTGASAFDGSMVAYGSVFTSAVTACVAMNAGEIELESTLNENEKDGISERPAKAIELGIKAGLLASRKLLEIGFGKHDAKSPNPSYPGLNDGLFEKFDKVETDKTFACQAVRLIDGASTSDRSFWRLLDSIFEGKEHLLRHAVSMTATNSKPRTPEEVEAEKLLRQVPYAVFAKDFKTCDRREIENFRALYTLMLDYTKLIKVPRPLSIAVFGPPGSGKSFGVKMVAKALGELGGPRKIETLTFNLSQYENPDQLADAFHLVRDHVLRGKIPLVFFDEFDSPQAGEKLGWLKYFLAPMQDGEFLDKGYPHPIGQAIFIFAGGTCSTYAEFAKPFLTPIVNGEPNPKHQQFKDCKGPDFLSRLRGTLDIPGLELYSDFDAYGPTEYFPCQAAILLRRAGILAHQISEKAPRLKNASGGLEVHSVVLRTLLHLPNFLHGNRSFEALIDMSSLTAATQFLPSHLPSSTAVQLHANSLQLTQMMATEYPFPDDDRLKIAQKIHKTYTDGLGRPAKPNAPGELPWDDLSNFYKNSNIEQASHIAVKLRAVGLWFRKKIVGAPFRAFVIPEDKIQLLAKLEHDRWVAEKRSKGWIAGETQDPSSRNDKLLIHNCIFPWDVLVDYQKKKDVETVKKIPEYLEAAGYEIIEN